MPSSACKKSARSEEHTSELQSRQHLVCRLLLEKKNALFEKVSGFEMGIVGPLGSTPPRPALCGKVVGLEVGLGGGVASPRRRIAVFFECGGNHLDQNFFPARDPPI